MAQYRVLLSNGGKREEVSGTWDGLRDAIRDPFTWMFCGMHFSLINAQSFKDFFPSVSSGAAHGFMFVTQADYGHRSCKHSAFRGWRRTSSKRRPTLLRTSPPVCLRTALESSKSHATISSSRCSLLQSAVLPSSRLPTWALDTSELFCS